MGGEEASESRTEAQGKAAVYQEGIRPTVFKTLMGKGNENWQSGQQQDASEYFGYLLDRMMAEEKKAKAPNPGTIFDFELEKRL